MKHTLEEPNTTYSYTLCPSQISEVSARGDYWFMMMRQNAAHVQSISESAVYLAALQSHSIHSIAAGTLQYYASRRVHPKGLMSGPLLVIEQNALAGKVKLVIDQPLLFFH